MQRRTSRTVTWAAAVAATSALLTGCFTVEATFTINEDATADLDYLVLIDTEQLQEFAGLLGEDAGELDELSGDALLEEFTGGDDPCADLTEELADYEVSIREIDENGEVGVGCTVSGVPIAELNSLGDDTSSFSIEQDDDGTRFRATLEGVDELDRRARRDRDDDRDARRRPRRPVHDQVRRHRSRQHWARTTPRRRTAPRRRGTSSPTPTS
jgi:hypothetical protein